MLNSGIIDLAIAMAFIFGATAGLASVVTELIARFLGLRGAYLLAGLRELLDSKDTPVVLNNAETDFQNARKLITGAAGSRREPLSATSALLGSPILSSQGMTGNISTRHLTVDGTKVTATAVTQDGKPAEPTEPASAGQASSGQASSAQAGSGQASWPKKMASYWSTWRTRRSLPSYISSRSFAEAVVNLVLPDASGQTSMDNLQAGIDNLKGDVNGLPGSMGPLMTSLQSLASSADGDITKFRNSIEHWYDDHMDRVSGWYKRRTAWITLAVGAILVVLLNINAVTVGRALYSDSTARTAVSTVAAQGNPCPVPSDSQQTQAQQDQAQQDCLANLETRVSDVTQAGLPLGWGIVPVCSAQNAQDTESTQSAQKAQTVKCGLLEQYGITTPGNGSPWQVFLAVLGFLATIVALTPGAQFWFGLVVKLNSLRSSGPPPASSAS
jgi:hypothetical protein